MNNDLRVPEEIASLRQRVVYREPSGFSISHLQVAKSTFNETITPPVIELSGADDRVLNRV